jgi:MFS family permease
MLMMVNSVLVYRLTGSAADIGVVVLAQALPAIIVALFGGAIADRAQKKYILFYCQMGLALVSLGFALTFTLGYLDSDTWWLIIIAAACQGGLMGFLRPASMSIIPEIVGTEQVMNAISLSSMGQTVFRMIGPAVAGFLIDKYGFAVIYYLMPAMYAVGCVFTLLLPRTSPTNANTKINPLGDILNGLRYIRRDTAIMAVVLFGLLHVIAGQPFMQLMTIFTDDILKVGATGLGILTSVSAGGSMLGAFVLASLPNRKRGLILVLSGVIMGVSVMVFAWSRSWILSLAVMPFAGLGPTMHMTMTATIVQYYVEPNYRGRMQSFVTMSSGLAGFGTFLAGILSEAVGVQWAVGGMAIFLTVVSLGYLAFVHSITRLE